MSVRLQGLPALADSIHIRKFFNGLKIPSGGVTIIGGVKGEAFVEFKTSEDACHALKRSGRLLMNSRIHIFPESKAEQAHTEHHRRSEAKPGYVRILSHPFDASFADVKTFFRKLSVKSVIFLLKNKVRNGQALVKFAKHSHASKALSSASVSGKGPSDHLKRKKCFSVISIKKSSEAEWIKFGGKVDSREKDSSMSWCRSATYDEFNTLYMHEFYIHLMNVSRRAEKWHIKKFLYNLVDYTQITFVYDKNGSRTRDCFVMFVTNNDYTKALGLDKTILNGRAVRVLPVSKVQMTEFINNQQMYITHCFSEEDSVSEVDFPSPCNSGLKMTHVYSKAVGLDKKILKRRPVRVLPVSKAKVTKRNNQEIDFTLDPVSDEDFVEEVDSPRPCSSRSKMTCIYTKALNLEKSIPKRRPVRVLPVSKAKVTKRNNQEIDFTLDPVSDEDFVVAVDSPRPCSSGSKLKCIYLRNFAANVNKSDIINFFTGFALNDNDVYLLCNDSGNGLGEALVKFSSEEDAARAERLNHKRFRGSEILLRCISEEQLKVFGVDHFVSSSLGRLDSSTSKEQYTLEELQACVSIEDDDPDTP